MPYGTPLTAEDAARLHMSERENPMAITAVLLLEGTLDYETLVSRVEARLLRHPRFRQRVAESRWGIAMPRWLDDPSFDVRAHVRSVDLPAPADMHALEALAGELASQPFDVARPLWSMRFVPRAEPGAALVVRVHHALADGAALLSLLDELSDEGARAQASTDASQDRRPSALPRGRRVVQGIVAAGRLAMQRPEPRTPLGGRLGARKVVAFSSALSLEHVKAAAHALDTTVVGLLLAAVTGALRAELAPKMRLDGLVLHALLPLPLRDAGHPSTRDVGNHFGSVFVPLPIGVDDADERVRSITNALASRRMHGGVAAGARLAIAAGVVTAAVERLGVAFFSRRASVTVSSVRGSARALHLGGVLVRDVLVCAPAPGRIAVGVTLMSYAGRVRIGVVADARTVEDAGRIVHEVERELSRSSPSASQTNA